jgi:predicted AAA+ superfamily ATPase
MGDVAIAYWANGDNRTAEIDFIVQMESGGIVPLEVKAATNLKAKSLKIYGEKFNPPLSIRTSLADFKQTGNILDIPLYALGGLKEIMGQHSNRPK